MFECSGKSSKPRLDYNCEVRRVVCLCPSVKLWSTKLLKPLVEKTWSALILAIVWISQSQHCVKNMWQCSTWAFFSQIGLELDSIFRKFSITRAWSHKNNYFETILGLKPNLAIVIHCCSLCHCYHWVIWSMSLLKVFEQIIGYLLAIS